MDNEKENETQPLKITGWRRYAPVEIAVFFSVLVLFIDNVVLQFYVYYRLSRQYGLPADYLLGQTKGGCNQANNSANFSFVETEKKVQAETAYTMLGIEMLSLVPSIFLCLLFGPWSDKNGRLPILAAPTVGSIFQLAVALLVMYLDLSIYVLFAGSLIAGLFGQETFLEMSCMSYIADVTVESKRVFRIAILQLVVFIAAIIGFGASGILVESFGFKTPIWLMIGCNTIALLYIIIILPESRPKTANAPGILSCISATWRVMKRKRESPNARSMLIILIVCNTVSTLINRGFDGIINLFWLGTPFCFSSSEIGYLNAYMAFVFGAGAVVGVKLLERCMMNIHIGIIGSMSLMVAFVWLGLSNQRWMAYLFPVLGFGSRVLYPVTRGMTSQIVEPDEQGALFANAMVLETIAQSVGQFIVNPLYAALVQVSFGGGVFLVAAGATLGIATAMGCLSRSIPKKRKSEQRISYKTDNKMEDEKIFVDLGEKEEALVLMKDTRV